MSDGVFNFEASSVVRNDASPDLVRQACTMVLTCGQHMARHPMSLPAFFLAISLTNIKYICLNYKGTKQRFAILVAAAQSFANIKQGPDKSVKDFGDKITARVDGFLHAYDDFLEEQSPGYANMAKADRATARKEAFQLVKGYVCIDRSDDDQY